MKKLYVIIIFIVSVVAAYYVTKTISDKQVEEPVSDTLTQDSVSAITGDSIKASEPLLAIDKKEELKKEVIAEKKEKEKAKKEIVKKEESLKDAPKKHVNISLSEMKQLIVSGKYVNDRRLSKKYRIEYVDISDDDALEGLQQNFTYVQQRVEFGDDDDNGWRGFEVVGLDYDERGLVNRIKIKPIY